VDGREDGLDRLRLTFGAQHVLASALGRRNRRLLLALGLRISTAARPLPRGSWPAFTVGAHLLLHRVLIEAGGSIAFSSTRLTRMPHLPVAVVEHAAQLTVDRVARGEVFSSAMPPITLRSVVTGELLDRLM
jgi:hypothetical protein